MITTKKIMFFVNILILSLFMQFANSQNYATIRNTLSAGGVSETITKGKHTYFIQQSIGQLSSIGTFNTGKIRVQQGFIQRNFLKQNVDDVSEIKASIFPNPVADKFTITLLEALNEPVDLNIYDTAGKKIYNKKFTNANKIFVDLSNFTTGIYFINISTITKKSTYKLIKK